MSDSNERRMIGDTGYEVKHSMYINGKDILIAENMDDSNGLHYLVCQYRENGIIGEYSLGEASGDYLEILREFVTRINTEISAIQSERDTLNLPGDLFTAAHCYEHDYRESIDNKVVVIKATVFSPPYRRGDNQLVLVAGGNGATANARGSAVYCYHLNDGKHTRFERYDVQGVMRPEHIPEWANHNLNRIRIENNKPSDKSEYAGKYEIIRRIVVGNYVFAMGHNPNAAMPYGTWISLKNNSCGFDSGNYFQTYSKAKDDLHARAGREQQQLDIPKRNVRDSR